jgi:hypothetical protein
VTTGTIIIDDFKLTLEGPLTRILFELVAAIAKSGNVEVLTLHGQFEIDDAPRGPHTWSFLINSGTKARFESDGDAPVLRASGEIVKLAEKYGVDVDLDAVE